MIGRPFMGSGSAALSTIVTGSGTSTGTDPVTLCLVPIAEGSNVIINGTYSGWESATQRLEGYVTAEYSRDGGVVTERRNVGTIEDNGTTVALRTSELGCTTSGMNVSVIFVGVAGHTVKVGFSGTVTASPT